MPVLDDFHRGVHQHFFPIPSRRKPAAKPGVAEPLRLPAVGGRMNGQTYCNSLAIIADATSVTLRGWGVYQFFLAEKTFPLARLRIEDFQRGRGGTLVFGEGHDQVRLTQVDWPTLAALRQHLQRAGLLPEDDVAA